MGLLDNLLNRNPTADWRAQPGLALVLDLDEESFCGIRLGEKAERLEKLGPAEDAAKARIRRYRYTSKGFVATLRNWEQGRRVPDGPALALLRVAAQNPRAVVAALHPRRHGAA